MDILGYLKNTHKNPKFGKVRQVPTREFPTKFPDWDLDWVFFKYPKISKNGNPLFFPVYIVAVDDSFNSLVSFLYNPTCVQLLRTQ